jgi:hypothetical protein
MTNASTLRQSTLRAGTAGGLAMIPFAAMFRANDMRVNEYGRKSLELLVGEVGSPTREILMFGQHMVISWSAALPLLWWLGRTEVGRGTRALVGLGYGTAFYIVVNSWLLPLAFGDPSPWRLGLATIVPSLFIHLVFGVVVAVFAPTKSAPRDL